MSDRLRFEERDIVPWAVQVSAKDIREGEVYFIVNYYDEMLVPVVSTVVFIGRKPQPGDVDLLYFKDVRDYRKGPPLEGLGGQFIFAENETSDIFQYERALDQLLACSLRRRSEGAGALSEFLEEET